MAAAVPKLDIVVMMSVKAIRPTTNPYIVQLMRGVGQRSAVSTFSWRRALFGRVDVFHLHWPEAVFSRDRKWVGDAWALLFAVALIRMRLARVAIVRTLHNVSPHEGSTRIASAVLSLCDRVTTGWIRLNPDTDVPSRAALSNTTIVRTIPHGHYRDWFANKPHGASRRGRILVFGQVRQYKGTLELIAAFRAVNDPALELHVLGRPSPASFGHAVQRAAGGDPRIILDLNFIDDERLAAEIGAAELVVLPYRRFHNSGAALLALSLDRAVLVPDGIQTRRLVDEVGAGWVHRFGVAGKTKPHIDGEGAELAAYDSVISPSGASICSADIVNAFEAERRASVGPPVRAQHPKLVAREWSEGVRQHIEVYVESMDAVAGRPNRGHTR